MTLVSQKFLACVAIAALMFATFGFNIAQAVSDPTTITNPFVFDEDVDFDDDVTFDDSVSFTSSVTYTGDTTLGTTSARIFEEGGAVATVATTASTYTLTAAEMLNSNVINVTAAGTSSSAQAALTLTLPATSTITAMLATAGEVRRWYIMDNHGAVGTTTTIAAGTGIDLEIATSSPNAPDRTIRGGSTAELILIREPDTDIRALLVEFNEGD